MRGFLSRMPSESHSRRPLPIAETFPALPDRHHEPVRDRPSEVVDRLEADRLLPLEAHGVLAVQEVDAPLVRERGDDLHAAVEVRVEAERRRAVRERLRELLVRDLRVREEDDGAHSGRLGRIGRERRRRVARRRAAHEREAAGLRPRDSRGHPAVLEGERRVLALVLDEETREPQLLAERAARVEARRALGLADEEFRVEAGQDVLAVAPDAAALERARLGRAGRGAAAVEEVAPFGARVPEGGEVRRDVEELAARGAGGARLGERVLRGTGDAAEAGGDGGRGHRSIMSGRAARPSRRDGGRRRGRRLRPAATRPPRRARSGRRRARLP